MFAGPHHPLKVWVLCRYFLGLHVSNEPIAQALAVHGSEVQQRTTQRREGIVKKSPKGRWSTRWSATKPLWWQARKASLLR